MNPFGRNIKLPNPGRPGMRRPGGRKPWWWGLIALIAAGLSYVAKQQGWIKDGQSRPTSRAPGSSGSPGSSAGRSKSDGVAGDLPAAIRAHASGVMVESSGVVVKVLPDDKEGDRHQRFLVRIDANDRVLIAHNLDLSPRVPIKEDDVVRFKGEFEWNDRGGVVHWTHRDPRNYRPGGWIEVGGKRYD